MTIKSLNKTIGEAVLISPLFVISVFIDLWTECLLTIVLLFLYKSIYPIQYHSNKNIVCIAISYSIVIFGLILSYVFRKEYILLVLFYNIIAYASAKIGNIQIKANKYDIIAAPYAELVEFYHKTIDVKEKAYSFEDLLSLGLTNRQADLYIAKKRGIKGERLIDYMLDKGYDFSKSTYDREIKIIKKVISDN